MTSGSFGTLTPTLEGYFVYDAQDALAIIQLVLEGKLTMAHRRPKDPERQYVIKSGNVFVFKEMKGHIQRWTDGVTWSASRILTPFLVYRQDSKAMLKTESAGGVQKKSSSSSTASRTLKGFHSARPAKSRKPSADTLPGPISIPMNPNVSRQVGVSGDYYNDSGYYAQSANSQMLPQVLPHGPALPYHTPHVSASSYLGSQRPTMPLQGNAFTKPALESHDVDYDLFGSLKDAHFAEDGLAKKTISVKYQGVPYRLISYFTKPDVIEGRLKRPSNEPMFRDIVIEKELWESVQENKTPLDMSELYYSNAAPGQYPALAPMQPYSGYPPPQMNYGGYQQEMASRQPNLDPLNVYPDAGEHSGSASRNMNRLPSAQAVADMDRSASQYNLYSSSAAAAAAAAAAPPPLHHQQQQQQQQQHWYNDGSQAYRMPGAAAYASVSRRPDEHAAPKLGGGGQHLKSEHRHPDDRISDLYVGGYDNSPRYAPSSTTLTPDSTPVGPSHHRLSQSSVRRSSTTGLASSEDAQRGLAPRQQDTNVDLAKGRGSDEALPGTNPLAESLDDSPQIGQHQDLLPSISPDSSPLEPPIRTGISATTFIPQNYEYCDPEDSNDVHAANTTLRPQSEEHDNRAEFRQYGGQPHGPPSATQSKASPNVYFSTGRAWS